MLLSALRQAPAEDILPLEMGTGDALAAPPPPAAARSTEEYLSSSSICVFDADE